MLCRIGFCEKCFKEDRPQTKQHYLVYGSSSEDYHGMTAKRNGRKGFTPHLYHLIRAFSNEVYYKKLCCMVDCGTYLVKEEGVTYACYDDDSWSVTLTMPLKEWNALCGFKNTGLKI